MSKFANKLTNRQVNEMMGLLSGGETASEVGRRYGVVRSTVMLHAKRRGVRSGWRPKIDMTAFRQAVEEGAPRRDLENRFAVSGTAVLKAKRRLRGAA